MHSINFPPCRPNTISLFSCFSFPTSGSYTYRLFLRHKDLRISFHFLSPVSLSWESSGLHKMHFTLFPFIQFPLLQSGILENIIHTLLFPNFHPILACLLLLIVSAFLLYLQFMWWIFGSLLFPAACLCHIGVRVFFSFSLQITTLLFQSLQSLQYYKGY